MFAKLRTQTSVSNIRPDFILIQT